MKTLIAQIIADLDVNLSYLQWVRAIDNELLPPDGVAFPGVGVKDGDIDYESHPGTRDKETLTITVVAYQSLLDGSPGAAIMGSAAEQGDAFKGLIEIAEEIRTRLNDNLFTAAFGEKIYWAHVDQVAASETLSGDEGTFLQMKRLTVTYRRFS